jgi:UDP-N-acetylmuramate--alanine ligase
VGLPAKEAGAALSDFEGVGRRFDVVGKVADIVVVDDYAHHPTEIAATIQAACALNFERVHVVFQPHRYSRVSLFTEVLRDSFASAFDAADSVTFMDVFPAGETPIPGISGKTFMDVVLEHTSEDATCPEVSYVAHGHKVIPHLVAKLRAGDLVITMGAGDITALGPQIVAALKVAHLGSVG